MTTVLSHSPEETEAIAADFARGLKGGEVIGLVGVLGAGKTCFMHGVPHALPLVHPDILCSPTFTIMNEYPLTGGGVLYHIDLYRLDSWQAFVELGGLELLQQLDSKSFVFIEWADRYPELAAYLDWTIDFEEGGSDLDRSITILGEQ